MSRAPTRRLLLFGLPGAALQAAGLAWAAWPGAAELDVPGALLLAALGTLVLTAALESFAATLERSDRWALCALLGLPGLWIVSRLRPAWAVPHHVPQRRTLADRLVALLLCAAVGSCFAWGSLRWSTLGQPPKPSPAAAAANERLAYQRLGQIMEAQHQYRQRDWDGDGDRTYARFHVHLWQSVRTDGQIVPTRLIPRRLGLAMVPGFALDGYYYRDVFSSAVLAHIQKKPASTAALDPAREWAVAALPHKPKQTGTLSFVAHSSGAIWAQLPPSEDAPSKPRWVKVGSMEQLKRLQAR